MLAKYDDGWRVYSKKDAYSNELKFSSQRFSVPLVRLLEFQKMFSKTQLLCTYYEEKKTLSDDADSQKGHALFIADWVYFHWWKFQQRNHR